MGKRIAGDCSRKRRFCFVQNPAKAAYYAAHRARRFARRFLKAESASPSELKPRGRLRMSSCCGLATAAPNTKERKR